MRHVTKKVCIVYHLSLCEIVAKMNYNMFQSRSFGMWWSHVAKRELMIVETTHAFVKLKQIKAAGQPEAQNLSGY